MFLSSLKKFIKKYKYYFGLIPCSFFFLLLFMSYNIMFCYKFKQSIKWLVFNTMELLAGFWFLAFFLPSLFQGNIDQINLWENIMLYLYQYIIHFLMFGLLIRRYEKFVLENPKKDI